MKLLNTMSILLCLMCINLYGQNQCVTDFKEKYSADNYQDALTISQTCSAIDLDPELCYYKARCHMFLAEYKKALPIYQTLNAIDPKNVDYLNGIGAAHYMLDENDSALFYYNKTLALNPNHINALENRQTLHLLKHEYELALIDLELLIKLEPDNSEHWVDLGDAHFYADDNVKALESYNKALEINPKNANAYMSLAELKSIENDYEKAHLYVNKGIAIKKDDPLLYAVRGDAYYFQDEEHYKEALKAYLKSLKLEEDADVTYYAALCYQELGDMKNAIIYFRRAIVLGSIDPDCYRDFAYAIHEDEPDLAMDMTKVAVDFDPYDPYTHALRGVILHSMEHYENAIECFSTAIELDTVGQYYLYRAMAYKAVDSLGRAIDDFTKSIEYGTNLEETYYQRAKYYLDQEKFELAKGDLDEVLKINNENSQAFIKRAACNHKLGNFTAACVDMKSAADLGEYEGKVYVKEFCQ